MNENSPQSSGGYGKAVASGAYFTAASQSFQGFLQVITIIILARLLEPNDFGLVAMVFPMVAFAAVFHEAGFNAAILQKAKIDFVELNTLFWMTALIGIILCCILFLLAPAAARFYGEPEVFGLTIASGALVLAACLSSHHTAMLNREMRYRELSAVDCTSLTLGSTVAIISAYLYSTYWAVFLLPLVTTLTKLVLSWSLTRWRPSFEISISTTAKSLKFGGNMILSSTANFFGRNIDKVLIGRGWGSVALGYYERAYKIVLMPILFVHSPMYRLVVPVLSRTRDDEPRYSRIYILSYQMSLLITVPGICLFIAIPNVMVEVIMGTGWVDAAPIFAWLALASLAQLTTSPLSMIFVSQGRGYEAMISGVAGSCFSCLAFFIGISWGAVGVAAAYAISEVLKAPILIWYATRRGPVAYARTLGATYPFLVSGGATYAISVFLHEQIGAIGNLLYLPVAAAGAYVFAIVSLACFPSGYRFLREAQSALLGTVR